VLRSTLGDFWSANIHQTNFFRDPPRRPLGELIAFPNTLATPIPNNPTHRCRPLGLRHLLERVPLPVNAYHFNQWIIYSFLILSRILTLAAEGRCQRTVERLTFSTAARGWTWSKRHAITRFRSITSGVLTTRIHWKKYISVAVWENRALRSRTANETRISTYTSYMTTNRSCGVCSLSNDWCAVYRGMFEGWPQNCDVLDRPKMIIFESWPQNSDVLDRPKMIIPVVG